MNFLQKHLAELKHEHVYVSWAWELRKAVESLTEGAIKAHETLTNEHKATLITDPAIFGSTVLEFQLRFKRTFPEYQNSEKTGNGDIYEAIRALDFRVNDEGYLLIPANYTIGVLLQRLGTNVARNLIHPDIWVRRTLATRMEMKGNSTMDWYPDTRFGNELATIESVRGFKIKITSNRNANRNVQGTEKHDQRDAKHESETGLDHVPDTAWDAIVHNDGTLQDLNRAAQMVAGQIRRHFSLN